MNNSWKQWEGSVIEGRFALGKFQGGSDHSAVFLTSNGPYSQKAAIKLIEANPATAESQLSRWERASKLSHPHLLRILESGRCKLGKIPMLYVVTEFADENLSEIFPIRALSTTETEYMLRSALEVLSYLHNAGLAHAALKPSNVMAVGDNLKLSSDTICGAGEKRIPPQEPTPYDAPEVATSGASPAADVWSLGMVLVQALTQRPAAGVAIRHADPAVPETLPQPFLEIARQCVRLDKERRWTVSEIAARLLPTPALTEKSPARSRYVVGAVALVALVALLAGTKLLHRNTAPVASSQQQSSSVDPGVPDPHSPSAIDNPVSSKTPKTTHSPEKTSAIPSAPPVPNRAAPKKPDTHTHGTVASAGAVAERVLPSVSQRSRNTITGKVRVGVRVEVDPSGRVTDAKLASPGPSRYFANVALESARKWKFTPPRVGEQAVPSEWLLKFAFERRGVEAQPQQVSP
jgi:TonB family protein